MTSGGPLTRLPRRRTRLSLYLHPELQSFDSWPSSELQILLWHFTDGVCSPKLLSSCPNWTLTWSSVSKYVEFWQAFAPIFCYFLRHLPLLGVLEYANAPSTLVELHFHPRGQAWLSFLRLNPGRIFLPHVITWHMWSYLLVLLTMLVSFLCEFTGPRGYEKGNFTGIHRPAMM